MSLTPGQDRALTTATLAVFFAVLMAALLVVIVVIGGGFTPAHAHPGRTDRYGCHTARKAFTYANGRTLRAGEWHCHPTLGPEGLVLDPGMKLILEEDGAARAAPRPCVHDGRRRDAYCEDGPAVPVR